MAHYDSQTLILPGWTIGAGVEHLLAPNWLVRLEYRYADLGQANPTFFAYNLGAGGDDRVLALCADPCRRPRVAYKF